MWAEPSFEILVGVLPISPDGTGGLDGATVGAEIVNVEGLWHESDITGGAGEIIKDEFSIFAKIEMLIETTFFGKTGFVEFVIARIEATIASKQVENVGFT